ncbi:hypothetical protein C7S13_7641 [Burkholderia cepacia]|nr:hypothetical protein [Burkholderia cepacia]
MDITRRHARRQRKQNGRVRATSRASSTCSVLLHTGRSARPDHATIRPKY